MSRRPASIQKDANSLLTSFWKRKRGATTVFLSSHILSDVERTCDHIVILRQGSVALSESMDALRRSSTNGKSKC